MVQMERQLLRVEEAADLLAISRSRAYELIAGGDLASVQIGRSRRVPAAAVEAFVRSRVEESL